MNFLISLVMDLVVVMYSQIVNNIRLWEAIASNSIRPGQRVVDCTVGNGNDTIMLAELVGEKGKVYGFDIQKEALDITARKLDLRNLGGQVNLILDGHENIDKYIGEEVDFIVYNLGYLPKGDKAIKTKKTTTIISLQKSLGLLKENGILVLTSYTGHQGGLDEKKAVEEYLEALDQRLFNVLKYEFLNQKNSPPILYAVEKSKMRR
ncbi:MAG: class I SAM-dependent methyltransferase [Tissierellaceae bacterium]